MKSLAVFVASAALVCLSGLSLPAQAGLPPQITYGGKACPPGSVALSQDMKTLIFTSLEARSTGSEVITNCQVILRSSVLPNPRDAKTRVPYFSRFSSLRSVNITTEQSGKGTLLFGATGGIPNRRALGEALPVTTQSFSVNATTQENCVLAFSVSAKGAGSYVKITKVTLDLTVR